MDENFSNVDNQGEINNDSPDENMNQSDVNSGGVDHNTSDNNMEHHNPADDNIDDVNRFSMDAGGDIRNDRGGAAAVAFSSRTYVILGWVSAAFAAFVSPLFAIGGIIFGVLANRESKGSGNAPIIASVVLAAVNMIFGAILMTTIRRMLYGF